MVRKSNGNFLKSSWKIHGSNFFHLCDPNNLIQNPAMEIIWKSFLSVSMELIPSKRRTWQKA